MVRRYIEYYRFDGIDYQPFCGSDSIQDFDNRLSNETIVSKLLYESTSYYAQHAKYLKEKGTATYFAIIRGTILKNQRISDYYQIK